jgi:hypothetical protein
MSKARSLNNPSGKSPFRRGHDVVMFLYLAAGVLGLAFLILMRFTTDGWIGLSLIVVLTSVVGWVPGVFLIVFYRHSWRVFVPAAILVVCLGLYIGFDLPSDPSFGLPGDSTTALVAVFYGTAFLIGIEWLIQKIGRSRHV